MYVCTCVRVCIFLHGPVFPDNKEAGLEIYNESNELLDIYHVDPGKKKMFRASLLLRNRGSKRTSRYDGR